MHLIYFDEVKYQADVHPFYRLCAIMLDAELVPEIEAQIGDISHDCFGHRQLRKDTEFHAKEIFHGKANFKNRPINERLDALERLCCTIDRHDEISKISIRIDPSRMIVDDFQNMAFMFLVERVQQHLVRSQSTGMLIGDHEASMVNPSIYDLFRFRESGTDFVYGQGIDRLIDTVHFTHSHHSRLLQAADVFTYITQMCESGNEQGYPRQRLINFVRENTGLLAHHKYKHWPTEQSRYQ